MRAKKVPYRAVVFDFDETIAKTDAKIHIHKNGRRIKSLTPTEFNSYVLPKGETVNFEDFKDPRFILNARKYKMWPAINQIYNAGQQGRDNTEIFILTARPGSSAMPINTFLRRNGIDIPLENVITIGEEDGQVDIPKKKREELAKLKNRFSEVMFYDDDPRNITLAGEIGVQTKLVDWIK